MGDYTAAAIASIAFGRPHAVVDGNVYRVLSRFYCLEVPQDTTAGKKAFAALAQEWLPEDAPGLHNQAMMELGALVCLPRLPKCDACPLAEGCQARAEGRQEEFPLREKRPTVRTRHFVYLYLRHKGQIHLHRRGGGDIWQGLYEPLLLEFDHAPGFEEIVASARLPEGSVYRHIAEGLRHQLTHQLLLADAYVADLSSSRIGREGIWVKETEREDYAVPRLVSLVYERIDKAHEEE